MDKHHRDLGRGFNWLGSATIAAKVIDLVTILAVLLFLTKEQVGIAALVVSIGMVVEAFNGLGTNQAVVQAPSVSALQLDTLFWFALGVSLLTAGLTMLAAPAIEAIYGVAGMAIYFLAVAVKQPLVGAAMVPLALMNRDLQYERIAIVNVGSTFAAALTRLGLAVLGAGVWALVIAYAANGLYTLIGVLLARPFRPGLRFRMRAVAALVGFGLHTTTANVFEQMFKNVDYLLIGWFYGASALAAYRVAFDLAMEPAMAAGTLITRVALPVFARLAGAKDRLAQSLTWSLRRLVVLVFPLMVGLILAANSLMALIRDAHGHSYSASALPLKLLAGAALLRATVQLLYPVMIGSGRPRAAARLSVATFLLLSAGIVIAGLSFPARTGIVAVSAVWLAIYPLILVWGARYLRRSWSIRTGELARAFLAPVVAIAAMVVIVALSRPLSASGNPALQLGIVLVTVGLAYGGLYLYGRYRPYRVA